jgi:hypothetical protein
MTLNDASSPSSEGLVNTDGCGSLSTVITTIKRLPGIPTPTFTSEMITERFRYPEVDELQQVLVYLKGKKFTRKDFTSLVCFLFRLDNTTINQSSTFAVCSIDLDPSLYNEQEIQYINSRSGVWNSGFYDNKPYITMRDVLKYMS